MSDTGHKETAKTLSFVVSGRNDDYCGNFLHRMQLAVNYLAWGAAKAGLLNDLELLIVDWNSEVPLSQALVLSPHGREITRFVEVPPAIAVKYHGRLGQTFNSAHAANCGFRRARGRFLFGMPADAIVPQSALHNLHALLNGRYPLHLDLERTLLKISRKMIPHQISDDETLGPRELEAYLADCASTLYMGSNARITAGLGAIGGSKGVWESARGLSEACDGWGFNDIDLGLRMGQLYDDLELSHFGILFYDLEQAPKVYHHHQQRIANAHVYPRDIEVNGPHWGLVNETGLPDYLASDIPPPMAAERPPPTAAVEPTATPELEIPLASERLARHIHEVFNQTRPKRVLELHARQYCLSTFLTKLDNTLDLAFLGPWHLAGDNDKLLPAELGKQLRDLRHRGRCEFFVGNPSDTLDRYQNKSGRKADLLIIHTDPWHNSIDFTADELATLCSLLSSRGQILLFGRTEDPIEIVRTTIQSELLVHDHTRIGGYRLASGRKPG